MKQGEEGKEKNEISRVALGKLLALAGDLVAFVLVFVFLFCLFVCFCVTVLLLFKCKIDFFFILTKEGF